MDNKFPRPKIILPGEEISRPISWKILRGFARNFQAPPVKILTISSVFNLLQPRLLASMLQSAVTAPCTMCTRDEYSGKSSCKIVTRVYCRCSVASRHEKSLPPPLALFGLPSRIGDVHLDHDAFWEKPRSEPGIKWKLNVFVSRACQCAPSSRVNLFLFDSYLCNRWIGSI